jgi:hypothetical protein
MTAEVVEDDKVRSQKFDLEERTALFYDGQSHCGFGIFSANAITDSPKPICPWRHEHYCAADDAVSRREFHHKIENCKKEALDLCSRTQKRQAAD